MLGKRILKNKLISLHMENVDDGMNPDLLRQIVVMKMPFGKYKNTVLADLPVSYLEYFVQKGGFPKGTLGILLSTVYEIKLNGLEEILWQLKKMR
jgi:uncharacterized protein (DUF3820 family)